MPDAIQLDAYLDADAPGLVAVTGGGGKTSLLFALTKAFADSGQSVLATTSTRMLRPADSAWLQTVFTDDLDSVVPGESALFAAAPPTAIQAQEKVYGYSPVVLDRFRRRHPSTWVLVEADGSAGRPLKAPAAREPVIPSTTTHAVAVVGLRAFGKPYSPTLVHRLAETSAITGLQPGETITPASLLPLVSHQNGFFKNAPAGAKRLLLLNQSDLPDALEAAAEFSGLIRAANPDYLDAFLVASLRTKGLQCLSYPVS